MYSPRPPAPIAAAIVADPTPTTAATRMPATIEGIASGSSTWRSSSPRGMGIALHASAMGGPLHLGEQLPAGHAHCRTSLANRAVDSLQTCNRGPDNRQQPVEDQHDDRSTGTYAAEQGHGQQKPEHREAGNGLHEVRDADER